MQQILRKDIEAAPSEAEEVDAKHAKMMRELFPGEFKQR
jgi:hypothetical protein